jgi:hypothetical protein
MESKVKELERISRIAYGKIPVSEESAVFSLFAERREVCKRIINEEISEFDFLGNEQYLKEQEVVDLLKNEDFQKQFICDSLLSNLN